MRKVFKLILFLSLIIWGMIFYERVSVLANEMAGELVVNITNNNSEKILLKDGETLYTCLPVQFNCITGDKDGKCYYSLSLDNGQNFGGYVEMSKTQITLYPEEQGLNSYFIKFKYEETSPSSENKDEALGDITSEESPEGGEQGEESKPEDEQDEEKNEETDENGENVQKNADEVDYDNHEATEGIKESIKIYESKIYRVQFDLGIPQINVLNMEVLDNYLNGERELSLAAYDKESFLSRIIVSSGEDIVYENHFAKEDNVREYNFGIPLNKIANSLDGQIINVKVYDLAGNSIESAYNYYLDKAAPLIEMAGIPESGIVDRDVNLILNASDDCDRAPLISYMISKDTGAEIITEEISESIENGRGLNKYLNEDGKYYIKAVAIDGAGNSSGEVTGEFIIDKNAPEIEISGVYNGVDIKEGCNILIKVAKNYYDDCRVNISAIKKGEGEIYNIPIEPFTMQTPVENRSLRFENDGDYEIRVSAVDRLGRIEQKEINFRIDKNAPLIGYEGLTDGQVTNSKPVIKINTADKFYSGTIVNTKLLKKISQDSYVTDKEDNYVLKNKIDSREISIDKEGEYELICVATDRTGNTSTKSVKFTVDYTPPVISGFDNLDGKYLKSYTLPEKIASLVSDITKTKVETYLNDKEVVSGEKILEDGKYVLYVAARDEADNYSDKTATFIVDHTAPQIVIAGLGKDGNVKKGDTITVSLADEEDELLSVKYNKKNVEFTKKGQVATFSIEDYGEAGLEISAIDKAGNRIDKEIHTSCYALSGPVTDYLVNEKIIHNIDEKIGDNDKIRHNFMSAIIGGIIVAVGAAGLMAREILKMNKSL